MNNWLADQSGLRRKGRLGGLTQQSCDYLSAGALSCAIMAVLL